MQPSSTVSVFRATINRENAQHSTGPRTEAGKQRSALNALTHGLTGRTPLLPAEDLAAYQNHCQQLRDEYQPKTPTETQLVQEIADTSWRLNRIPLFEADLLARAANPPTEEAAIAFDIVDAHKAIATLGMHSHRLSKQFHKALEQLRAIQYHRRQGELRDLKDAAAILELHKHKGIPWQPGDNGFVFSKDEVERASQRMMRLHESRGVENVRFGSFANAKNAF